MRFLRECPLPMGQLLVGSGALHLQGWPYLVGRRAVAAGSQALGIGDGQSRYAENTLCHRPNGAGSQRLDQTIRPLREVK